MEPHTEGCQPRQQVVSGVIPYLASAGWYSRFLKGLNATGGDGRNAARTFIRGNGATPLMISMAVEGGARRLRDHGAFFKAKLSDHGNWRTNHRRALEAAYGSYPYYSHLRDLLNPVYESGERSLADFNRAIHETLFSFLIGDMTRDEIRTLAEVTPTVSHESVPEISEEKIKLMQRRGREIAARIEPELSVIDSLMLFGKETVGGLLMLDF